jgi:hypothetical protein
MQIKLYINIYCDVLRHCPLLLTPVVTCYATKDAVRIGNPFITKFSLVTTIIHN